MTSVQKPIRVLIVDDSALQRRFIRDALSVDPAIEVAGIAGSAESAEQQIQSLRPDVLTLDIEMPGTDGLQFLSRLMRRTPIPVVICSSLARHSREVALEAMRLGAVEVVSKPHGGVGLSEFSRLLARSVKVSAHVDVLRHQKAPSLAAAVTSAPPTPCSLIAIGASTGGTVAIESILRELSVQSPPVVITQHIQPLFSPIFANRLNALCAIEVREAKDGDLLRPGIALIAPGDKHIVLKRRGRAFGVSLDDGDPVCYQKPSVDVMFQSAARLGLASVVGVILTGMGRDGAAGLLQLRMSGACTIAQDEATSMVYGMPKEAKQMGAVERSLPLGSIARFLASCYNKPN